MSTETGAHRGCAVRDADHADRSRLADRSRPSPSQRRSSHRSARLSLCRRLIPSCLQAPSPEVRGGALRKEWRCGVQALCALPMRSARSADVPPSALGAPCRCRRLAAAAAISFFSVCSVSRAVRVPTLARNIATKPNNPLAAEHVVFPKSACRHDTRAADRAAAEHRHAVHATDAVTAQRSHAFSFSVPRHSCVQTPRRRLAWAACCTPTFSAPTPSTSRPSCWPPLSVPDSMTLPSSSLGRRTTRESERQCDHTPKKHGRCWSDQPNVLSLTRNLVAALVLSFFFFCVSRFCRSCTRT